MPKVYGFCGTNKCKREVIARENIAILEGSILTESGRIEWPEGFEPKNTVVLSAMSYDLRYDSRYYNREILGVHLLPSYIELTCSTTVNSLMRYKIVLMKLE